MTISSAYLKEVYRNDTTIQTGSKLIIENNMNMLIDGIVVTSAHNSVQYTDANNIPNWPANKPNPFKKLFPVDSVVKPFRPSVAGVNQYILGSSGPSYLPSQKTQDYFTTDPRIYYPGIDTSYKYWVAPINTNADLTVRYKQTSETWKYAISNGDIPATSGGIPLGNKSALANKIVVKFEKFHGMPKNCTIKVEKEDGTFMTDVTYTLPLDPVDVDNPNYWTWDGVVQFFYNGSTWTTTEPDAYAAPILIKSINVKANIKDSELFQPVTDPRIAIIEISARLIKAIDEDSIVSLDITKQTSAGNQDLLPVGFVNSNSLQAVLYDPNDIRFTFKEYNRYSSSFLTSSGTIDNNLVYLTKNTKIIPYIKTYHSNGVKGLFDKYDETKQGVYYVDTYSIDEYGSTTLSCLDGSKYLMDTLSPDLLLEGYPVTAILRVLLDNIGFVNYNFNLQPETTVVEGETIIGVDKSIPNINHWWTTDTQTVWEAIQELCRDIQMNAFFDEEGILQFYSRDFIYGQSEASWTFRYNSLDYLDGLVAKTKLPNIITFNKQEIPSANFVKILWNTPTMSNYLSNSTYLWQSPTSYLTAGGLRQRLPNPTVRVTNAIADGSRITYLAKNDYIVGQKVSIKGFQPDKFNLSNATIISRTDSAFVVQSDITGSITSAGSSLSATITNAVYSDGYITYTANNSFQEGDIVTITGISPSTFGYGSGVVISNVTPTSFKVKRNPRLVYDSGGIAKGQSSATAIVTAESTPLIINVSSIDTNQKIESAYNYAGYFLIDSEIIEYDAIQYQYTPILKDDGTPNDAVAGGPIEIIKTVWITSASDISKYKALSKPGYANPDKPETSYFKPTGIYRIKTRGALGTSAAFHNATSDYPAKNWNFYTLGWSI